jgi:hypothetical protein
MTIVGLVAHAGAAQDVRRLTSLARTIDAHERVNVLARLLAGLGAAEDPPTVLYMAEPTRLVERALAALGALDRAPRPECRPADAPLALDAAGTRQAARAMAAAGAACVVTYGGDGTSRAVAAGWPDALMVPIPGGTNNAFAAAVDPTAAGLAAAMAAADPTRAREWAARVPRVAVEVRGRSDLALVDVALVRDEWLGTHAVWAPESLLEAVVTRADPACPGLCGVAGMVARNGTPAVGGIHLRFGSPGTRVLAPLGPGRLLPLSIAGARPLAPAEPVAMRGPGALALDGEREIVLRAGEVAEVRIEPAGPWVLDAAALLRRRPDPVPSHDTITTSEGVP